MSVIKNGYDSKETRIKINARSRDRTAAVWIEQEGEKHYSKNANGEVALISHSETLAYATLDELLDLRDELNNVIRELTA